MTFDRIEYIVILRAQNQFADALATLASMVEKPERVRTRHLEFKQKYQIVHKEKEGHLGQRRVRSPLVLQHLKFPRVGNLS